MKARFYFALLALLSLSVGLFATEPPAEKKPKAWFNPLFETRIGFDVLNYGEYGNPSTQLLDLRVTPGVSFSNGLRLGIPVEANYMMFTKPNRDWLSAGTVGLEIGYNFLNKTKFNLELSLSGGTSYLSSHSNFAYGEAALRFGTSQWKVNPYIGVGIRYINPYTTTDITQKLSTFFVLGFSF